MKATARERGEETKKMKKQGTGSGDRVEPEKTQGRDRDRRMNRDGWELDAVKPKSLEQAYFFIDPKLLGIVQSLFNQYSCSPYINSLFNFSSQLTTHLPFCSNSQTLTRCSNQTAANIVHVPSTKTSLPPGCVLP